MLLHRWFRPKPNRLLHPFFCLHLMMVRSGTLEHVHVLRIPEVTAHSEFEIERGELLGMLSLMSLIKY